MPTLSYTGHENVLAFANPDGSVVLAAQNDMGSPMPISFGVGDRLVRLTLPADSISTVLLPAG